MEAINVPEKICCDSIAPMRGCTKRWQRQLLFGRDDPTRRRDAGSATSFEKCPFVALVTKPTVCIHVRESEKRLSLAGHARSRVSRPAKISCEEV
jgi:hypothetical protein